MTKNYYEVLIEEIEALIKENKKEIAIAKIQEELKLPYVPKIYEDRLNEFALQLNINSNASEKKYKTNFSREELIIVMNEYEKHDVDFLIDICSEFEQYNWSGFEKKIEKIFNSNIDNKVKSMIYNNLVVQNLDFDFKINNSFIINPKKNKTMFETQFALRNLVNLSHMQFEDPSIFDICEKIFFIYVMTKFPESLFWEFNNITNELVKIAKVMIGIEKRESLNKKEQQIYQAINGK